MLPDSPGRHYMTYPATPPPGGGGGRGGKKQPEGRGLSANANAQLQASSVQAATLHMKRE